MGAAQAWAIAGSVGRKPVAKMIESTGRCTPSPVTIECSRTSAIGAVTSSAFGAVSIGYQSLERRIRLQPMW